MNTPRTLLLIGSSIMEHWFNPAALAPSPAWRVVNRAIGGTTTAYWAEHLPAVLAAENPDAVLAYVGSNDFAQAIPAATIAQNLRICRDYVRIQNKNTLFGYLGIIKAPQRLGKFPGITVANAAARAVLDPSDFWFETDPVFLHPDGAPVTAHYVEDGLHLTPAAYEAFTAALNPSLRPWLNRAP